MNRKIAKLLGQQSKEDLDSIYGRLGENKEFIQAYGDGYDIKFYGKVARNPTFEAHSDLYEIVLTCPEPVREVLEDGTGYYFLSPDYPRGYLDNVWTCDSVDRIRLKRGLIYLNEEDVQRAVAYKDKHGW